VFPKSSGLGGGIRSSDSHTFIELGAKVLFVLKKCVTDKKSFDQACREASLKFRIPPSEVERNMRRVMTTLMRERAVLPVAWRNKVSIELAPEKPKTT
jgi:biotin carboxylase